jgi:hypothetical protein
MFIIDKKMNIELNRGDIAVLEVRTEDEVTGQDYTFQVGDIVRMTICEKDKYDKVVMLKDVIVSGDTKVVEIQLSSQDTRIGKAISKPKEYCYTIELNPDTAQQTLIGHTKEGPKLLTLYPEGGDSVES